MPSRKTARPAWRRAWTTLSPSRSIPTSCSRCCSAGWIGAEKTPAWPASGSKCYGRPEILPKIEKRGGSARRFRLRLLDQPTERRDAAALHVDAGLAGALALFLDPPVGVVADADGLADDQVGRGQESVHPVQAFLQTAIVMQEAAAALFDDLAIGVDRAGAAADAEHAFAVDGIELGVLRVVRPGFVLGRAWLFIVALPQLSGQAVDFFALLPALGRQGRGPGFRIAGPAGQRLPLLEIGQSPAQLIDLG